jgi:hypothetical protein
MLGTKSVTGALHSAAAEQSGDGVWVACVL